MFDIVASHGHNGGNIRRIRRHEFFRTSFVQDTMVTAKRKRSDAIAYLLSCDWILRNAPVLMEAIGQFEDEHTKDGICQAFRLHLTSLLNAAQQGKSSSHEIISGGVTSEPTSSSSM